MVRKILANEYIAITPVWWDLEEGYPLYLTMDVRINQRHILTVLP